MHLTYTYQIKSASKHHTEVVTDIDVTVDYNPDTNTVVEIIDVYAHNRLSGGCVDIGRFLIEKFNLDGAIEKLCDWQEIYHSQKEEAAA